jgi:hypothetical protein
MEEAPIDGVVLFSKDVLMTLNKVKKFPHI